MPNLSYWVETGWWVLAIQGKFFDASHLWHDWFSFSGPSLWEVARAGSLSPGAPWPPTHGRCEAGNRWRQKPKKSIGPVSQRRGGRLLKTQSRHVFAAWCRSTAHLRTHWISPSPSLFIYSALLCTSHFTSFGGGGVGGGEGGETLISQAARERQQATG